MLYSNSVLDFSYFFYLLIKKLFFKVKSLVPIYFKRGNFLFFLFWCSKIVTSQAILEMGHACFLKIFEFKLNFHLSQFFFHSFCNFFSWNLFKGTNSIYVRNYSTGKIKLTFFSLLFRFFDIFYFRCFCNGTKVNEN